MSAAFPAFFPPHKVTASDLGVDKGKFGFAEQFLTDGGVYDNLGVRQLHILRKHGTEIDLTIVSDGGATVEVDPGRQFLGLVATAVRAADVLLQRVRNLEYEILDPKDPEKGSSNGGDRRPPSMLIRITDDVEVEHALPPRIQLALRNIRTDLDAFTDTEIKWLIRQGYFVAKGAVEASAVMLSELGIETNQVRPFDPAENLCRARGQAVTAKQIDDDWRRLKKGARRKYRIFAWKDWVSWVNIAALLSLLVSSILYYRGLITEARFFSDAYTEEYSLSLTYDKDIVQRWYDGLEQSDQEVIRKFVEEKNPIPAYKDGEKTVLGKLRKWMASEGKEGTGSAFLSVLGEVVPKDRDQAEEQRADPSTKWVGVLYYQFPPEKFDWTVGTHWVDAAKSSVAALIGQKTYTIIHFRGGLSKKPEGTLCFSFLQSPGPDIPRSEYDIQFKEISGKAALKGFLWYAEDVTIFANCEAKGKKPFRVGKMRLDKR